VEATKYAQSLIEALINDTDKKFEHQLPKLKPLSSNSSHTGQKQKQLTAGGSGKTPALNTNGAVTASVSLTKDDQHKNAPGKAATTVSFPSAWAQPSAAILQSKPKTSMAFTSSETAVSTAWNASATALRAPSETARMTYSERAKAAVVSTGATDTTGSWSPPVEKMAAASVEAVAIISSTAIRPEPVPLPIVVSSTAALTGVVAARPAAIATTIVRDYSPFDNKLSQITEAVLAKRTADDFASVAAAGVVVTSSQLLAPATYADESPTYQANAPGTADPDLMAKAPGYRPQASADPSKAPGHRVSKDPFGPRGCTTTSATPSDNNFQSHDFGRPSSTPTAAVSLISDSSLVGRALGASLDRPPSLYGPNNIYGSGPGLGFTQHGHLPPFAGNVHSAESFVSSLHHGMGNASLQQPFGAPCSLGSAVNETSVLAAPLMTTSVAPGSIVSHDHITFDHRLGVPSASSSAREFQNLLIFFCV
jgi:hypothetical protein